MKVADATDMFVGGDRLSVTRKELEAGVTEAYEAELSKEL